MGPAAGSRCIPSLPGWAGWAVQGLHPGERGFGPLLRPITGGSRETRGVVPIPLRLTCGWGGPGLPSTTPCSSFPLRKLVDLISSLTLLTLPRSPQESPGAIPIPLPLTCGWGGPGFPGSLGCHSSSLIISASADLCPANTSGVAPLPPGCCGVLRRCCSPFPLGGPRIYGRCRGYVPL